MRKVVTDFAVIRHVLTSNVLIVIKKLGSLTLISIVNRDKILNPNLHIR